MYINVSKYLKVKLYREKVNNIQRTSVSGTVRTGYNIMSRNSLVYSLTFLPLEKVGTMLYVDNKTHRS